MFRRWVRFNAVGAAGFVVQLGTVWLCVELGEMPHVMATLAATEIAVIHNFVWHIQWTWTDRPTTAAGILQRFLRFNLTNGAISLAGNAALVALLADWMKVSYVAANVAGIAICCLLNFLLSEHFVFAADDVPASLIAEG